MSQSTSPANANNISYYDHDIKFPKEPSIFNKISRYFDCIANLFSSPIQQEESLFKFSIEEGTTNNRFWTRLWNLVFEKNAEPSFETHVYNFHP
jgi:uncharacterized protein YozE (UPF0346 family)